MIRPGTIRFCKIAFAGALLFQWAGACREKYVPEVNYPPTGYLVVNGFIDASGNESQFRLSKTSTLDSAYYLPVTGATVTIEDENGDAYLMNEPGGNNRKRSRLCRLPVPGRRINETRFLAGLKPT